MSSIAKRKLVTTKLQLKKCEKCRVGATHRNDPPVAQLTGGIGQDEHGEAEDSQQLHKDRGKDRGGRSVRMQTKSKLFTY